MRLNLSNWMLSKHTGYQPCSLVVGQTQQDETADGATCAASFGCNGVLLLILCELLQSLVVLPFEQVLVAARSIPLYVVETFAC